ncbi:MULTISPECIES: group II truncated hemoglobin [unclassified Bradyrhizobium]|uniref:group II truncated hemoglobin n=1 Tax=unclassified Bradyrhizobium TaxID=2631580 RepID=UPI0028EA019C|nr:MULTISPECIES: group II truncated hemoglobin [unclassified Bradyrhizobium]
MSETETVVTPYQRIGGAIIVDRLVEAFYRRMDSLPEAKVIRDMHPNDLGPTKRTLKRYLSEWLGGPKLYSPEKGHPRLRQRHMGFSIGASERDAWLLCMRGALEETVADAQARQDVDAAMTKLADWMRNQAGNPHDARAARP